MGIDPNSVRLISDGGIAAILVLVLLLFSSLVFYVLRTSGSRESRLISMVEREQKQRAEFDRGVTQKFSEMSTNNARTVDRLEAISRALQRIRDELTHRLPAADVPRQTTHSDS